MATNMAIVNTPAQYFVASSAPVGQVSLHPGPTPSTSFLRLPTGQPQCRAFMIALATNPAELTVLNAPSWDIDIAVPASLTQAEAQFMMASHIRREGYFKAIVIQSRGQLSPHPCNNKCGTAGYTAKFIGCRTIPGYCASSCACCVYQSHQGRCEYNA